MGVNYDFSGWATRNGIECSDGRTICRDAFADQDGDVVPLVWNHQHNSSNNVLGHAKLENREEGVYCYGYLNDTPEGQRAKEQIKHGDITSLSIFANKLKQKKGNVIHGAIKEVSLVLAGANPGAYIDSVIAHGEYCEEDAVIYGGEELEVTIAHACGDGCNTKKKELEHSKEEAQPEKENNNMADNQNMAPEEGNGGKTIGEVFETFTEEQKKVVYAIVGKAVEDALAKEGKGEGEETMKHNCFDEYEGYDEVNVLSHSDIQDIFADAKRNGSLKESVLAHTDDYGISNVDYLFPDAKNYTDAPEFIKRPDEWVSKVFNGTHKTPFSRIKSIFADITEDEARAKGYIKGNRKKEEVFTLLKRQTTPTTIYKKQKLDRDDIVDIVDFDVVAWLKLEMRGMLDEEISRAILVGDGRSTASDDKISELNIRPIWKDDDLYAIKVPVSTTASSTDDDKAKAFIKAAIKARKDYRGSGEPSLYCTEETLTNMLLLTDSMGRDLFDTEEKLRTKLRVKEIVTVPVLEGLSRVDGTKTKKLMGIIVNLADYNIGADKGGAVNMFDDFDIDYNQQKYLIETRCSGALVKPFSALVLEESMDISLTVGIIDPDTVPFATAGDTKEAGELGYGLACNDNGFQGTLNYINSWTYYSQDTSENSGNFLPIQIATTGSVTSATIAWEDQATPTTFDSDGMCILRVTDAKKNKKLIITANSAGGNIVKTLSVKGLKLKA